MGRQEEGARYVRNEYTKGGKELRSCLSTVHAIKSTVVAIKQPPGEESAWTSISSVPAWSSNKEGARLPFEWHCPSSWSYMVFTYLTSRRVYSQDPTSHALSLDRRD